MPELSLPRNPAILGLSAGCEIINTQLREVKVVFDDSEWTLSTSLSLGLYGLRGTGRFARFNQ
jgi:hypothetical protein